MSKLTKINVEDVKIIARGAAILGTGGGGDPYIGRLMAEQAIRHYGPVELIAPAAVDKDAFIILVGNIGSPAVMIEKLPSYSAFTDAISSLEASVGKKITHIGCGEAGGINSMIPIAAAAKTGTPLIDADGMGRAFPELQMLIPALEGVSATPMSLTDEKGNTLVINTINNQLAEQFARNATVQMGAVATIALYPMNGSQIGRVMVPDTINLAYRIGKSVEEARLIHADPVAAVTKEMKGFVLFNGKIIDILRRTEAGFVRGEATLQACNSSTNSILQLYFQNEHLMARRNGTVVASAPDLICMLDTETGEPITTESMRYGQRVCVIGAPCFERWRQPDGLAVAGPKYFGYNHDYVPVEQLNIMRC